MKKKMIIISFTMSCMILLSGCNLFSKEKVLTTEDVLETIKKEELPFTINKKTMVGETEVLKGSLNEEEALTIFVYTSEEILKKELQLDRTRNATVDYAFPPKDYEINNVLLRYHPYKEGTFESEVADVVEKLKKQVE